ncbi:hypothetical protein HS088_TW14G00995 [Tripterygium wilfordii]|uniref:FAF domain-containing protein n=1 Tax=Tripterygium wilfordii TaxID=458696 RepID=A0A7J7CRX3_TRIWF|nr:protein FANTASTIC FOUR 3-like [Tripterygium wilfordii]XP_038722686.1 protein FANTASTIC FOUR 3-like [Tripterygium wilfordii]KAF5736840.1 hypothetical protein HS088_TW14G00995 [Tripterygium wilfordii]
MATIVCQGLQSCHESQLVESKTLRQTIFTKTHFPQPLELAFKSCFLDYNTKEVGQKFQTATPDYGGWSFIKIFSESSKHLEEATQKDLQYVPPQIKRTLSEKSLELCTENLGSETGTDTTEDCIFPMSSADSQAGYSTTREQQKPRQPWSSMKGKSCSFPPPLTTIRGSESLQVRPHREDGRLIIEAIKAPPTHTYFQAERSHGRLRLTLFKDSSSSFDYSNDADSEENEEEFENDNDNESVAEDDGVEEEEMDGNKINVGDELGIEKINQRPSRCKEGEQEKNGLLNWEPCWVASS